MFCNSTREKSKQSLKETPELTTDEINNIRANLSTIMDMNEKTYIETNAIITEVWGMLKGQTEKNNAPDSGKNLFKDILVSTLAIIGIVSEQPEIEIAAVIVAGVWDYLSTDSNSKTETNVNLDIDFGLLSLRNTSSFNALNIYIGKMYDDPNKYRDEQWTITNPYTQWRTLRDLINVVIPNKSTEQFQLCVQSQGRQFRNQITIPEMVKMQYWDVYFVQDLNYNGSNFGSCYVPGPPGAPNPPGGIERVRNVPSEIGNGVRIFANDEIRRYHPDYVHAEAFGNSNTDLKSSYLNAIKTFVEKFPAAYVYPWSMDDSTAKSWRYYIMEGYDKITNPTPNFGVANGDFMKWLFIDDGAGNIVNPEGVGYRYDIICANNIMRNEHMIPFSIHQTDFIIRSEDFRYPGRLSDNTKIYLYDIKKNYLKKNNNNKKFCIIN
jgi:hypothetical protein